jgi:hypothetical protein
MRPLFGCGLILLGVILVFAAGFLFPTLQPVLGLQERLFCGAGETFTPSYRDTRDGATGNPFTFDYLCVGENTRNVNLPVYLAEFGTIGVLILLGMSLLGTRRARPVPTVTTPPAVIPAPAAAMRPPPSDVSIYAVNPGARPANAPANPPNSDINIWTVSRPPEDPVIAEPVVDVEPQVIRLPGVEIHLDRINDPFRPPADRKAALDDALQQLTEARRQGIITYEDYTRAYERVMSTSGGGDRP